MTAIWMGIETVREAAPTDRLMLTGDRDLADTMERWLGLSPFAGARAAGRLNVTRADASDDGGCGRRRP